VGRAAAGWLLPVAPTGPTLRVAVVQGGGPRGIPAVRADAAAVLARQLAMAGRTSEAREVFERAAAYVNDVGLFAEEIDPATGEQLGNTPLAFSHIGLVNAAWSIHQAEQQARRQIDPGGEVGVLFPAAHPRSQQ